MELDIYFVLTVLITVTAIATVRVKDLLAVAMLLSVYSALMALIFAILGAVDVAFTEAVVGTGISTVFLMALIRVVDSHSMGDRTPIQQAVAVLVAGAVALFLLDGIMALPDFGDPQAAAMKHVSPVYLKESYADMHTPNVVTAVLGDYRGLDTLIETGVVLTAALACLLILGGRRNARPDR